MLFDKDLRVIPLPSPGPGGWGFQLTSLELIKNDPGKLKRALKSQMSFLIPVFYKKCFRLIKFLGCAQNISWVCYSKKVLSTSKKC